MNAPAAINALDWLTMLLVLCSAYCLARCTVGYLWGYSRVHSRSHHFRFSSDFFLTFYTAELLRVCCSERCTSDYGTTMLPACTALLWRHTFEVKTTFPGCTHRMCWAQNDTSCDTAWWGFHTNVTCWNAHLGVTPWRDTAVTPMSPFDNSSRRDNILWPDPCFYIT